MGAQLIERVCTVRFVAVTWAIGLALVVPQLLSGQEGALAQSVERPAAERAPGTLRVAWVGDITLGSGYGLPPREGRALFAGVRRELAAADLTIGNLEGTLSAGGVSKCAAAAEGCFAFQAPPANAAALRWARFDVVNLANNHSYDYGEDGRRQTLAALDAVGVTPAGLPGQITVVRRAGIDVALVGFAPYPWANDNRDLALVRSLVSQATEAADVVLVLAHLGAEGNDQTHVPVGAEFLAGEDRGDTRAFAHAAVEAGADAVLASGPHVLRGMERHAERPIAYSLANFAGYRNFATTGVSATTALLELELEADGTLRDGRIVPLTLDADGIPSRDRSGTARALIDELSAADFGANALRLR